MPAKEFGKLQSEHHGFFGRMRTTRYHKTEFKRLITANGYSLKEATHKFELAVRDLGPNKAYEIAYLSLGRLDSNFIARLVLKDEPFGLPKTWPWYYMKIPPIGRVLSSSYVLFRRASPGGYYGQELQKPSKEEVFREFLVQFGIKKTFSHFISYLGTDAAFVTAVNTIGIDDAIKILREEFVGKDKEWLGIHSKLVDFLFLCLDQLFGLNTETTTFIKQAMVYEIYHAKDYRHYVSGYDHFWKAFNVLSKITSRPAAYKELSDAFGSEENFFKNVVTTDLWYGGQLFRAACIGIGETEAFNKTLNAATPIVDKIKKDQPKSIHASTFDYVFDIVEAAFIDQDIRQKMTEPPSYDYVCVAYAVENERYITTLMEPKEYIQQRQAEALRIVKLAGYHVIHKKTPGMFKFELQLWSKSSRERANSFINTKTELEPERVSYGISGSGGGGGGGP